MSDLQIVSFLPAATEMAFALGLGDAIVGVSHKCDFPTATQGKPIVVKPALPLATMSLREIDAVVAERIGRGQSLYEVDENLLELLAPTHILTQNLCAVCAPSGNEITHVLATLPSKPQVLWFSPHSLAEIFENLCELAGATDCLDRARQLIAGAQGRLQAVSALTKTVVRRPRVLCLEWIDPYYCCGHWVPEMIEIAGGEDALGRKGADSVRIAWSDIVAWAPEILIVSPCGFKVDQALAQARQLLRQPGWSDVPAVHNDRVFAVDANAYFARPGPRAVDGVELLAHLIHPELCAWSGVPGAFERVKVNQIASMPARNKICPECGASFCCGPQAGKDRCWCQDLPPLAPSTAPGADCLCPVCLAKAIGAAAKPR